VDPVPGHAYAGGAGFATGARRSTVTARTSGRRASKRGVTWAAVRKLALSFPGVTEGTSYGEHAFLLDGKFFSRFNAKEEGLVVYAEEALRDALLAGKADCYFTTDHYRNYPYVLARLEQLPRAELAALYEAAFRAKAKKKRVAEYDARSAGKGRGARDR
jgi:hypothetical protein